MASNSTKMTHKMERKLVETAITKIQKNLNKDREKELAKLVDLERKSLEMIIKKKIMNISRAILLIRIVGYTNG